MATRRLPGWTGFVLLAVLPVLLPLLFPQGYALTLFTQAAVMIVFAQSYNLLYGQAGMLSFGHALYFGMGAFSAVHGLNAWGGSGFPVTLLPLAGGLAGALCAFILGWVSTRRGGLTFAMISLGVAELALAAAPMLPGFFGGEGGITTNRVTANAANLFGISYGPAIEVYALVAAWMAASVMAMHAFALTPLGRMANAVRDNAERAAFLGCDPRAVRWRVMLVAGFFAGLAGALGAIQYEVATSESLGHAQSAAPLIATVIGGAGAFFGPAVGAILYTLMSGALGSVTPAWPFYLGCLFITVMLFAPDGLVPPLQKALHAPRFMRSAAAATNPPRLAGSVVTVAGAVAVVAGLVTLVELVYLLAGRGETGELARLIGLAGRERDTAAWTTAAVLLATGIAVIAAGRRVGRGEAITSSAKAAS